MKFFIGIILVALGGWLSSLFLPWWGICLFAFLIGIALDLKPASGFFAGLLGGMILWGLSATLIDVQNQGILSGKMGELFGGLEGWALIAITALIGGLLGGMGCLTGTLLRRIISK